MFSYTMYENKIKNITIIKLNTKNDICTWYTLEFRTTY